jgi:transposase
MLSYKAALAGSLAIKVDADYTSQSCPYCGYADKRNRPGKGLLFICQHERNVTSSAKAPQRDVEYV